VADKSREAGHAIADHTRSARDTIRDDSKKAGHAIADGARTVGRTVREGFQKLKTGTTGKSSEPAPKS
jgi:predicted methyltransferase